MSEIMMEIAQWCKYLTEETCKICHCIFDGVH